LRNQELILRNNQFEVKTPEIINHLPAERLLDYATNLCEQLRTNTSSRGDFETQKLISSLKRTTDLIMEKLPANFTQNAMLLAKHALATKLVNDLEPKKPTSNTITIEIADKIQKTFGAQVLTVAKEIRPLEQMPIEDKLDHITKLCGRLNNRPRNLLGSDPITEHLVNSIEKATKLVMQELPANLNKNNELVDKFNQTAKHVISLDSNNPKSSKAIHGIKTLFALKLQALAKDIHSATQDFKARLNTIEQKIEQKKKPEKSIFKTAFKGLGL
jgi:hypothetical protein